MCSVERRSYTFPFYIARSLPTIDRIAPNCLHNSVAGKQVPYLQMPVAFFTHLFILMFARGTVILKPS